MNKKLILILVVIGVVVYFNSLFNHFVWDDEEMVSGFLSRTPVDHTYFRPIMSVIYYLIFTLFNGSSFFFRLFQVVVHVANAILIFFLFNFFFSQLKLLSFFLALIFLVHPINSEAVLFISATQEPLFVFLGLAGLLILIRKKNINLITLVIVTGILAASLLIKETGIVFFVLGLFYLLLYQQKSASKFFIITIMTSWLYWLLRVTAGSIYVQEGLFPIMKVSLFQRILTIPQIIFYYIKQFFFPWRLAIAQHWVVRTANLNDFLIPLVFDLVFLGVLGGLGVKTRSKPFVFFFVWFLVGLLPHLQIIPLNMTAAERWFYLPGIGMLGMVGTIVSWLYCYIDKKTTIKQWINLTMIIVIILLSTRTIVRSFDWRNGFTLFSHDIKITAATFDLTNNFGVALFRVGKVDEAKKQFAASVKLAPDWWVNWNNLGAVYEKKGELELAENYYKQSIKNGDYYLAYENFVGVLIKQGKTQEAREFLETQALIKFSNNQKLNQYDRLLKPLD